MIFTNTCKYCQLLSLMCTDLGFSCVALHSMIKQKLRLSVLQRFKSEKVRLLIATDVASRGLDIPSVDVVINHNVPTRSKDYVHRVGRTARAGRSGRAITLVTPFDVELLQSVEKVVGTPLEQEKVNEKNIAEIVTEVSVARRQAEIYLDSCDFGLQRHLRQRKNLLIEGIDPDKPSPRQRKGKRPGTVGNDNKKLSSKKKK